MSTQRLTGFDNTDLQTDEPDSEVFLYDAGSGKVICASCDPSGAQPEGRLFEALASIRVAARIPAWTSSFYASRLLSPDGNRLFFESYTPLAIQDTNNRADVYEWEAVGTGSCNAERATYSPESEGCIYLISSGESSSDSTFVDASADGSDVFIKTAQSLLPQDPGLVDIYDARVDGGLPTPSPAQPGCEGAGCQGAVTAAPEDPTPASLTPSRGNVPPSKAKPCAKGKHKVKGRCVKKKKQKKAKAGQSGRAGR
jgi:hypothetical protein